MKAARTFEYHFGATDRIFTYWRQIVERLLVEVESHLVRKVLQSIACQVDSVAQFVVEIVDRPGVTMDQQEIVFHKRVSTILIPPTARVTFQTGA